ncbi:chondroitinase-B domain-containing protein [Dysgonomonas sp. 520]|uniref:chondroitinase-B domain-containing protein n=1 Tax=Dysgonomonas sp. 520 TaxID=2302931 RepID=UPI0013D1131A|nr:chondroitinase-B domain-containing protein [Dysgonomonas sp. 520]NDW09664.1 T9SS C-terminal target domain-containing protein [Dysgonomonas sp. 520]
MKNIFTILTIILLPCLFCNAQDILLNTSFEDYSTGNIDKQNKWSVTKGSATIVQDQSYSHTETNGIKYTSASGAQMDHIAYTKAETGLTGEVYVDFWIKINSISTGALSITGYDLGSKDSRSFMIEFSADGKIKVYSGSSGSSTIKPTYTLGQWNRISFKQNNTTKTYQFALNGNAYTDALPFREVRQEPIDYHSIRFLQSSGTFDVAIDDIYIGSNPISDIDFQGGDPGDTKQYTLSINQPQNATISISPEPVDGKYTEGTKVTASVTISDLCKYRFNKWTGDLSATSYPTTFTMTKNMTIGADVSEIPAEGTVRNVKTYAELKNALSAMNPGDIIELEDGTYSGNGLTVTQTGCETRPIIIRAKNIGQARLTGKLNFTLRNISHVTFEGLIFDLDALSTIFKMEGCSYVRITKNEFRMKKESDGQTSKWITIGDVWDNAVCRSHHNRIDHNLFDGKYDGGAWVVIDGAHGTSPGDISKYDVIDHNHFRNNTPRVANEKETIRVGVTDLTPTSAYCTIEYNLFENCDGDPEVVSIKSCDNLVRGNTFRGCLGTVCLRQGSRNTVDGNYFFGDAKEVDGNGCGGVRVYGIDHKIINNYFEGLTGEKWDAACTITNGDVSNPSSSWSSHNIPENVVFAFNTYINNKSDIEIGFNNEGKYGKVPKNCLITNNIYINNENPIVKVHNASSLAGVSFSNNIMYATENGSIGTSLNDAQAKQIDPGLIKTNCKNPGEDCNNLLPYNTYKLDRYSPAIDAATLNSDYSTLDFEGQPRKGNKDIGADERSDEAISNGILGIEHVGPHAIDFELTFTSGIDTNKSSSQVIDCQVINKTLSINFFNKNNANTTIKISNLNGTIIKSFSAYSYSGLNNITIPLQEQPAGVYLLIINNKEYEASRKFILK